MLHLVGILFPHINDDARSKSHQCIKYVSSHVINYLHVSIAFAGIIGVDLQKYKESDTWNI